MNYTKPLTYISLFSSAGVGCFSLKKIGFDCIATNEIIKRRIDIQRINNKCKYETGYILGDIKQEQTLNQIFNEIHRWGKREKVGVDIVIATPPCQGMSIANHKKTKNEIIRNSLVVESISIVKQIKPKFFIFENVASFMKTGCTAKDGTVKEIGTVIYDELGIDYQITDRVLNFKNYGSNSSRTRTIVIGVRKDYKDYITPLELFPSFQKEKSLRSVIGDLPSLKWGEFDKNDFYHQFRTYDSYMRDWIKDLKEGEGAFNNNDPLKRPHRFINGKIIENTQKNADKYTRQYWDKVGPCIHTRNDQLASQNTIHPTQDRVFSIRELMRLMTIPNDFKWINKTLEELNNLPLNEKRALLKANEINIRQSIGEAVPPAIFYQIASNIKNFLLQTHLKTVDINKVIEKNNLYAFNNLQNYLISNPLNLDLSTLSRIAELVNNKRESNAAYFTNSFLINEIIAQLPTTDKTEIDILEPAVGIGNFIPFLIKKYENINKVNIDICDIDKDVLKTVETLLKKVTIPSNIKINIICDDFLLHTFNKHYFLTIGNPPFSKLKEKQCIEYYRNNINKETTNLFEFFLEKAIRISEHVAMITPKFILNTPEFKITRNLLEKYKIDCIEDFGEQGFKGVLIETVCLFLTTSAKPNFTKIISTSLNKRMTQKQKYIFDPLLPYWVIYRNNDFDSIAQKMEFGLFNVFRDRQITNSNTCYTKKENYIRVLKSRNINDLGTEILDIPGYDSYIAENELAKYNVNKYKDNDKVYLTPNMTYNPRVIRKPKGCIVNGSVAILLPKNNIALSQSEMNYYSTAEFRNFYKIARNYQTRSLNIDNTSVYWFGRKVKK